MIDQLQFTMDGKIKDKVEIAIQRLKAFEPPEGYYVAFSGGKDSQCVYHLCQMAGVKFDAHYAVTSVDPPELVRFIKDNYPDVKFERQYDKNGKPITMWSLIADNTLPPTRKVRYCCSALKETGGQGRVVVTGVRWAESSSRKNNHDVVDIRGKKPAKTAEANGAEYRMNNHGDVIMNDDNDENRRTVEQCYRTHKTMVNPIVDWEEEDVWGFLNGNNIPHCSLYDEGFTRLGCIGCPLSGQKNMIRDFERWPKYKELYIRAFQKMIDNHPGQIKILDPNADTKFKLFDGVSENIGGGYQEHTSQMQQTLVDGTSSDGPKNNSGGGTLVRELVAMELIRQQKCTNGSSELAIDFPDFPEGGYLEKRCSNDGSKWHFVEGGWKSSTTGLRIREDSKTVFSHWVEMGAT